MLGIRAIGGSLVHLAGRSVMTITWCGHWSLTSTQLKLNTQGALVTDVL